MSFFLRSSFSVSLKIERKKKLIFRRPKIKVSLLAVVALWGDYTFILADLGS